MLQCSRPLSHPKQAQLQQTSLDHYCCGVGVLFGGHVVGEGGLHAMAQNRQTDLEVVHVLVLTCLTPRPIEPKC